MANLGVYYDFGAILHGDTLVSYSSVWGVPFWDGTKAENHPAEGGMPAELFDRPLNDRTKDRPPLLRFAKQSGGGKIFPVIFL